MKFFVAICLLYTFVAVHSACLKSLLPSLISTPVAAIPTAPVAPAPIIGPAVALPPGFGIEPIIGFAPGFGCGYGPAIKYRTAGIPLLNVPFGGIAI